MYLKLTRDFFAGNKIRFIMAVISIAILIASYLYLNIASGVTRTDLAVPDLMYTTKVIDEYKWVYLEDFTPQFVDQFQKLSAGKAEVVPVTQRFMLNIMNALGNYRFQLMGIPQQYMDRQLKRLLITGRIPEPGEPGLILGTTAANTLQLAVGDTFTTSLADAPDSDPVTFTVLGILNPDAHEYFDRTVFIVSETYTEITRKTILPNTLFIFLKDGVKPEVIGVLPNQIVGNPTITATALKGDDFRRLIQLVSNIALILLCSLSMYQSFQVILNNSTRRIGLLKAMGMSDFNVLAIFVQGVLGIFALSFLLGNILNWIICYLLNEKVGEMLATSVQIYKVNGSAILSLLGMLFFALVIIIVGILYKTRRVPPRRVLLEI